MPRIIKITFPWIIQASLAVLMSLNPLYANSFQGISTYYIRYDVKFSNHKITDEKLTMVPAEKEYRAEIFSQVPVSHMISADLLESKQTLMTLAKKNAFIRLLQQNGLKSITTMNQDTIISYEAVVHTPVEVKIGPYGAAIGGYPYTAHIRFAPLAFPDQWESLRQKFKIKEIFDDFILLFN